MCSKASHLPGDVFQGGPQRPSRPLGSSSPSLRPQENSISWSCSQARARADPREPSRQRLLGTLCLGDSINSATPQWGFLIPPTRQCSWPHTPPAASPVTKDLSPPPQAGKSVWHHTPWLFSLVRPTFPTQAANVSRQPTNCQGLSRC